MTYLVNLWVRVAMMIIYVATVNHNQRELLILILTLIMSSGRRAFDKTFQFNKSPLLCCL